MFFNFNCCSNEYDNVDETDELPAHVGPLNEVDREDPTDDDHSYMVFLNTDNVSGGVGLVLKKKGMHKLFVLCVKKYGVVRTWNMLNADSKVQRGDEVVCVNGISNDVSRMVAEFKTARHLNVMFQRPRTFRVTLDKNSRMLGMMFKVKEDVDELMVINVTEGRCREWNQEHPDEQIMVGDIIREVNGLTGAAQMTQAVTEEDHLELVLHHHFEMQN